MDTPNPESLPDELTQCCRDVADEFDVDPRIHALDFIFHFVRNHEQFADDMEEGVRYYFSSGADSATMLHNIVVPLAGREDLSVLDFASGYGCVTRHLRNALPDARVVASDIHPEAIAFLQSALGVDVLQSVPEPEDFPLPQAFDVVFAFSFFSHIPKRKWARWLRTLAACTAPSGLLLFTTHGLTSASLFIEGCPIDESGFGFQPVSEQQDIDASEYGTTITLPRYVFGEIEKLDGMRLIRFQAELWWGHQDLYVLRHEG